MTPTVTPTPWVRWQDHLLDGAVVLFALWTLASHLTVARGGTLGNLQAVFMLFVAGAAILWWRVAQSSRFGKHQTPAPVAAPQAPPRTAPGPTSWLPRAGVAVATVAFVALARRGDGLWLWWWVAVPLVLGAIGLLATENHRKDDRDAAPAIGGSRLDALPWLLAVLAVLLTLAAHRPDYDDSFYINLAVHAVDHPHQPILFGDTLHGIEGLPLHLPLYRLHAVEMWCATVARWTGLPAIVCFHWLLASLGAFLLPLAMARLLRLLTPRTWPWVLVFFLVVLLAVGTPHRWYGNFAFVRIWQGKSIFLSVALPLVQFHALRFALRPNPWRWILLAACQIAALGLSVMALTLAPLAAMIAALAVLRPQPAALVRLASVAASSFYPVVAGLATRGRAVHAAHIIPSGSPAAGDRLETALGSVLGDLWLPALAALLLAWPLIRSRIGRRFALLVPCITWLVVLNPHADGLITRYVVGSAYWRALWLLPVPLLLALVLASPLGLFRRHPVRARLAACGLLALFVWQSPGPHGLSKENRVRWRLVPELRVPPHAYAAAQALQLAVSEGAPVVAPAAVGLWIPTFHHHAYPLAVRHYLDIAKRHLDPVEVEYRYFMTRFVDSLEQDPDSDVNFRQGLEWFQVQGVCLRERSPNARGARAVLKDAGFTRLHSELGFELWVR